MYIVLYVMYKVHSVLSVLKPRKKVSLKEDAYPKQPRGGPCGINSHRRRFFGRHTGWARFLALPLFLFLFLLPPSACLFTFCLQPGHPLFAQNIFSESRSKKS